MILRILDAVRAGVYAIRKKVGVTTTDTVVLRSDQVIIVGSPEELIAAMQDAFGLSRNLAEDHAALLVGSLADAMQAANRLSLTHGLPLTPPGLRRDS